METILVSTQELADHLGDPDWVVFDTRHDLAKHDEGRHAYAEGHVPGAYYLDLEDDLSGPKTGRNGRHPLPDLAEFARRMNERGVKPSSQVVVYDDSGASYAGRLWWMLRWLGHERTALLDGGFPQWEREGRHVSSETPAPRRGDFVPRPRLGATVDAHFVARLAGEPSVMLVDARAADRYTGAKETLDPVAGHIPGSLNRHWQKNLQRDGLFKPPQALREELLALLGGKPAEMAVHSCGSGVTACHNIFAMELAGLAGGRLYPGSWSEWCADPARPIATGPDP